MPRQREAELMDDPGLDPAEHGRALAGLARINRFSGGAGALWPALAKLARAGRPIRALDVATGSGDLPVALARLAKRAGLPLELAGCDISPVAVAAAQERAAAAGVTVRFFRHDVLATPLPTGFDAVFCSLFLHHLDEPEAAALLRSMGLAAGRLVLVNDLARSRRNLAMVWLACRALSRSPVVHADGPRSVRAAYTPAEALALAARAGLTGATVAGRFPCRYLLEWRRPT